MSKIWLLIIGITALFIFYPQFGVIPLVVFFVWLRQKMGWRFGMMLVAINLSLFAIAFLVHAVLSLFS